MRKASSLKSQAASHGGFTLMELLVVLLIIGVLSTVAIRTIDATRDRSNFDQTATEMRTLVAAMVGNPDMVADGRRTDFGFYGDVGRLPRSLRELVTNTEGDPHWKGPYLRRPFFGDSTSFLDDAWGNPYTYDDEQGTIATIGNKYPMTVRVVDSMPQLIDNSIVGQVMDREGNPPGEAVGIQVALYPHQGGSRYIIANRGGDYEFSLETGDTVPIGIHRLVAYDGVTDSIVHWVTVGPRSRNVVDFRFGRSFQSLLRVVGQPSIPAGDSSAFLFDLVSEHDDQVVLDSFSVLSTQPDRYFATLSIDGQTNPPYPMPPGSYIGPTNPHAPITPGVPIEGQMAQRVTFGLWNISSNQAGSDTVNVHGATFRLQFSDGSVVTVKP